MNHGQQGHFAFEYLLFESFRARDAKNSHWADGLLHVVPHEQLPQVALHHQHAQYHQVLFWLENLFPQAAQWLGVRELARLALDFLENSPIHSEDPILHAQKLIEILSTKRSHLHVAQLEALMRCGIAAWKVRSAKWRPDIATIPRERPFSFMTLVEQNQVVIGLFSIYGRALKLAKLSMFWVTQMFSPFFAKMNSLLSLNVGLQNS